MKLKLYLSNDTEIITEDIDFDVKILESMEDIYIGNDKYKIKVIKWDIYDENDEPSMLDRF